ncbi:MAG: threonine--tRNA ligase [Candidatus Micrarchaeota archaeon]|nr:threonine--tRNA ligase [Candidatus Micrarchaeota archaeon]
MKKAVLASCLPALPRYCAECAHISATNYKAKLRRDKMKILMLHADHIEWEPKKKAIKSAEETEKKVYRVEEALVVFSAVEKVDEQNPENVIEKTAENVKKNLEQLKVEKVVVYPYAHLSPDLSNPQVALKVLKGLEEKLKADGLDVWRAPFGWYKAFEIKCKGHPLSELSREILPEGVEKVSKATVSVDEEYDPKKLLREISKSKLDRENLKENDHRILGQRLDLFSFNEVAPGMVFWHHKGLIIYNELVDFWRQEHRKAGYQEISTPMILDRKLWQISGHWEKYKENIFLTKYEDRAFAVKPMNCPGGMLVFKAKSKSYRDLPLRVGELGIVHRQELSGVLTGLFRVIKFTQDDAHIFCTEEQLEDEIVAIMDLVDRFYRKFGFTYHVELSTRPEKRIGDEKIWDKAEKALEDVLKKKNMNYKINEGDGAFYGPKIDFHIKDSMGRTWQCATIQLDFAMPERFELEYTGEDNMPHRPVMLHRVIYGSLERFIGILLEHLSGNLPVWLSPVQVRVLSFTEKNRESAEAFYRRLEERGIRAELDASDNTVEYKVRDAELQKIPYIVVIGNKEEEAGTIAVRSRGKKGVEYGVSPDKFIENVLSEIKERK